MTGPDPAALHDEAVAAFDALHALPPHDPDGVAELYRERVLGSPSLAALREAFDAWCALWFWPADRLDLAPLPSTFDRLAPEARAVVAEVAARERFFHWELEFPDVFARPGSGFDAILGNPPWDTVQPNSKEFFSALDPLYRAYGKQEALKRQKEIFEANAADEEAWLGYNGRFKAFASFAANAAAPFGDPAEGEGVSLHRSPSRSAERHGEWRSRRGKVKGYADREHPFRQQGEGKPYTYKLFLEEAHALLRPGGRLGFLVPSGLYTDKGSIALRRLFVERCRWEWLFGFENREAIFDIHRSFKFGPVILEKGGSTTEIRTAFMRHALEDWEDAESRAIPYSRERVSRFSPKTLALLEIRHPRDLEVLEKIYAGSVLLGDDSTDGWGIKYAQGDFNMTSDSHLFAPRPEWEAKGYRPDEYGRWIGPEGDVALPLYQGVMIGSLESNRARWIRGAGVRAEWEKGLLPGCAFEPQYLILHERVVLERPSALRTRILIRNIARTTDERTLIGSPATAFPAGHSLAALSFENSDDLRAWSLSGVLGSFPFDWLLRQRLGGTNLSKEFLEEVAVAPPRDAGSIPGVVLPLAGTSAAFAQDWISWRNSLRESAVHAKAKPPLKIAITPH